jgi:hypothetical protein
MTINFVFYCGLEIEIFGVPISSISVWLGTEF